MENILVELMRPKKLPAGSAEKVQPQSFKVLITPALYANGAILSGLLLDKRLMIAAGIAAGCAIGILIYAALISVMDRALTPSSAELRKSGERSVRGSLMLGALVGGKFIVVGALLYLFFEVLRLSILAFVIGFLVTQCFVSLGVYRRLTKSKVSE